MITVLMATFQGKRYLEQQLDSILAQTMPVRLLISDDGSSDGTRELLEQYGRWYPSQIVLDHRTNDAGEYRVGASTAKERVPNAAQNFFWLMAEAAREESDGYVMFSDQDDVWSNQKVRVMNARMCQLERELGAEHPILLYSDMEVVGAETEPIHSSFFAYQHCDPDRTDFSEVLVENPVTGGSMMINRALLKLVCGSLEADGKQTVKFPAFCCMHDWWIAMVAACFGTIDCVKQPLSQYRQHGSNTLGAKRTGSFADLWQRLGRTEQVRQVYGQMLAQASAFLRRYGRRMPKKQERTLLAFLELATQTPAQRFCSIKRNHFYKSSRLQTAAMCVTMPRVRVKAGGEKLKQEGECHEA